MASRRLTNFIRDQIARAAIANRFDHVGEKLRKEEATLAEYCYELFFGDFYRAVKTLPAAYFRQSETIIVVEPFGGRRLYLHFTYGITFPIPYDVISEDNPLTEERAPNLAKAVADWNNANHSYLVERQNAFQKVRELLASVSTVGKLVQIWPEVEPFIPKEQVVVRPTQQLAIPIPELNLLLGLVRGDQNAGDSRS